jgi:hypothetical protein
MLFSDPASSSLMACGGFAGKIMVILRHHGLRRVSRHVCLWHLAALNPTHCMSAKWQKADIPERRAKCLLMTHSEQREASVADAPVNVLARPGSDRRTKAFQLTVWQMPLRESARRDSLLLPARIVLSRNLGGEMAMFRIIQCRAQLASLLLIATGFGFVGTTAEASPSKWRAAQLEQGQEAEREGSILQETSASGQPSQMEYQKHEAGTSIPCQWSSPRKWWRDPRQAGPCQAR